MKRLLQLAALVAVMQVITATAGVDGRLATNRDRSAAAIRISPPSPPPQQRQPYQQQQQQQQPYLQQQRQQQQQQQRQKQRTQQQPNEQRQQQATITEKPKLETTTQDRSIITVPLKMCPEGQRMTPDRQCGPNYVDPEDEKK